MTGTSTERPGLTKALAALSTGDTLIVWKLDRLGRSLAHLVQLVADLGGRGIGFRSLSDPIDTESAGGRLVLHIMGALAEFERSLIVERTQAGLQAAKKRGRKLGRPTKLTAAQAGHARALLASGEDGRTVARSFGVARSGISPEMAIRLEKAFGTPAREWLMRQLEHELAEAMHKADGIDVQPVSGVRGSGLKPSEFPKQSRFNEIAYRELGSRLTFCIVESSAMAAPMINFPEKGASAVSGDGPLAADCRGWGADTFPKWGLFGNVATQCHPTATHLRPDGGMA